MSLHNLKGGFTRAVTPKGVEPDFGLDKVIFYNLS
jgi:hypothetical protein